MFDWLKNIFNPPQEEHDNIVDKQMDDEEIDLNVDDDLDTNFAKGSSSDDDGD
ncbi:hypothetical protein [Photobacterium sanctipauli]|uniref:hypothetical protein n=1 Tax=Photobacterium sanctipauli TaxID=1342794 RepID=UPI000A61C173|nr:hypothetical protein [Photobacterium sanctipauli]